MRSYRMFWQTRTEDAMHRAWSDGDEDKIADVAAKRKERANKWFEAKQKELNPPADEATSGPQADAEEESVVPLKVAAAPATTTDAAAPATTTDAAETAPTTGSADKVETAPAAPAGDAGEGSAAPADKPEDKADAAVIAPQPAAAELPAVPVVGEPADKAPKPSAEGETTHELDSKQEDQVAGDGDISMAEA